MKTVRYEFILRADQPVAHAQETLGNISLCMRRSVRMPDGTFEEVPCITADTMRHGLRESIAYAYLDAAGINGASLTEEAMRLLFAGGMVTGSSGGSVKLGQYQEMVELYPALALLGGCAQNRVIPGRLFVDDAQLICSENRDALPEWVLEWCRENGTVVTSHRTHVELVQRVRMDPSLDPTKRSLLRGPDVVEQRLLASEDAATTGDAAAAQDAKSTMMPRQFEAVKRGSLFYWAVQAVAITPLDHDTLLTMVATFLHSAHVGGKKATGHGRLRAVYGHSLDVRRPSERTEGLDVRDLGSRVGELFRAHVADRRERIGEFLAKVAA